MHWLPSVAGPDPRPFSATFPALATLPHHVVSYGPDIPNERAYRLPQRAAAAGVSDEGCKWPNALSCGLAGKGRYGPKHCWA